MLKRIPISSNDFSLFDAELNSYEYEYFCKHIGAFKRFMQEEPKEQRQLFLDAFCEYSYNHIEIKAIATMSDPKKKFIENFRQYTQETFINGKFSAAKQFLNDSVIVARNKHMIQYMDSHSYAKDPFFHKDTRDVFRRLFGEPTEAGTCVKVICVLPLYVRFAGSICRYLKKWLDMEESLYPIPVKGKKSKAEKKALKEQALAAANAAKTLAIAQQTKATASKPVLKLGGASGNAKSGSASGQKSTVAGSSSKTAGNDEKSKAIVSLEDSKPTQAELDAAEDFSNYYYDLHERKQRKRDIRKKGKKHEHIPCQHPCHGKVCNCNPHKHVHTHDHTHDHAHNHHHHHHCHDPPQATREELMNCLCERHKALAQAKIAEKRAALQKQNMQSDGKQPDDKNPEGDKNSSDKHPEDKSSVVNTTENGNIEDKSPRVETSDEKKLEEKSSEETNEESVNAEDKCSEDKTPEDANSINEEHSEKKPAGDENLDDNSSKDKNSSSKSSEEDKNLDDKTSEGNVLEENEKPQVSVAKEPEVKSPRGKKSHKRIRENGVVSSEEESDCDEAVERFVRRTFPELHLQEPHPNQVYKQMVADEKEENEKLKESKLRTCAFCRLQETEAKTFKKCQKCKGKGTKFYCSRECQKLDWTKHRLEH